MDSKKKLGEKARWELHKNATHCFEFQSFPSRLVAHQALKNSVCPTIYPLLEEDNWIHTFPKGISAM